MDSGTGDTAVRIVIESLDPPAGQGSLAGHEPWTFTGWLELIEKVEQIRSRGTDAHDS